ncbi:hypothetical protein IWW50_000278 [Coemansia erecta]|nr:hypothetical protein IWW50_000278 [Coemansia erecta]
MPEFFVPEVVAPVRAIMARVWPDVVVEGAVGGATSQTDFFLVVTLTVDGRRLHSADCVEFKMPYGSARQPDARSRTAQRRNSETNQDLQLRRAGFPTKKYGKKALCGQLCAYVRSGEVADMAPARLRHYINETWGVLTDFNTAWVARFTNSMVPMEMSSSNPAADDGSDYQPLGRVPRTQEEIDQVRHRRRRHVILPRRSSDNMGIDIDVSDPFLATDASVHIAFVYAYILDAVVTDIQRFPENYHEAENMV